MVGVLPSPSFPPGTRSQLFGPFQDPENPLFRSEGCSDTVGTVRFVCLVCAFTDYSPSGMLGVRCKS